MEPNPYDAPRIEIEDSRPSLFAKAAKLLGLRPTGRCSFCGERKRPLAEGIDWVLICRDCAAGCCDLIDKELSKTAPR